MVRQRESWIDCWKGILIFLVVLGHVVGMLYHYTTGCSQQLMENIYKGIYLFHMPAFFFLAGYVRGVKGVEKRCRCRVDYTYILCKARRLLVPYVFWGVVSVVVFLALNGVMAAARAGATTGYYSDRMFNFDWWRPFVSLLHAGGWPHGEGFRCNSVLWFLPVMFVVSILSEGVGRLRPRGKVSNGSLILCLTTVACFALGGVLRLNGFNGLPWGIGRVPFFLGFMLLGELAGMLPRLSLGTTTALWGVYAVLVWLYPNLAVGFCRWKWYGAEIGMAVMGCWLSLGTARVIGRNSGRSAQGLAGFGLASLGIMVTHKFLVLPVQVGMGWLAGRVPVREDTDGTMAIVWLGAALIVSIGITYLTYLLTLFLRRTMPFVLGEQKH